MRQKGTREPIPLAQILLAGGQLLAETGGDGAFAVSLPPGHYVLEIRAAGQRAATFTEDVQAGERLEVVYRLEALTLRKFETVVRSERERTEVSRVVLRGDEAKAVPGTFGDPFRAVMLLPGVASVASGLSYPVVRGTQPAATGYFIDGVRVPMLYHLVVGHAVVHPELIDKLDFRAGAPPARFGRGFGGVVDASLLEPRPGVHAQVSVDLLNAGAFVEVPIASTGTDVTLAGRLSYSPLVISRVAAAVVPPDPQGFRPSPVADFYDYQARIQQRLGDGALRLLALGAMDTAGLRAGNPDSQSTFLLTSFHRVDLRYRRPVPGDLGELELGATAGVESAGMLLEHGSTTDASYTLGSTTLAARAGWSWAPSAALRLSAGADIEQRRARSTIGYTPPFATDTTAISPPQAIGTFAGVFGQLEARPFERLDWDITAGLRLDSYFLAPGTEHVALDPRLSTRIALRDNLDLKAGFALVHQPPTVLMALPLMDIAGLRYGLQESAQLELGAQWTPVPGLEVSGTLYYSALRRTVEFDLLEVLQEQRRAGLPGSDPATWGRAYGFELMARHPMGNGWFAWLSYSLSRSTRSTTFLRFDDAGQPLQVVTQELPFAFDQTHVFNASVSKHFDSNWSVGLTVHFNTGRPESGQISSRTARAVVDPATGANEWLAVSREQIARLPPYFRVDARVAKEWAMNDFRLEAYLDFFNVSFTQEVLGYTYGTSNAPGVPVQLERRPLSFPVLLPMLGLKGTY